MGFWVNYTIRLRCQNGCSSPLGYFKMISHFLLLSQKRVQDLHFNVRISGSSYFLIKSMFLWENTVLSGLPGTRYVTLADLVFAEIHLYLPPKCCNWRCTPPYLAKEGKLFPSNHLYKPVFKADDSSPHAHFGKYHILNGKSTTMYTGLAFLCCLLGFMFSFSLKYWIVNVLLTVDSTKFTTSWFSDWLVWVTLACSFSGWVFSAQKTPFEFKFYIF